MTKSYVENAWTKEIKDLLSELDTDQRDGLSAKAADKRLDTVGANTFGTGANFLLLSALGRQFLSPLILVLLAAAFATYYVRDYVDCLFILLAVATSVALGFYQEYKAERATAALRSYIEERVRVRRGGQLVEIDAKGVVPGDILELRAGERVPADGRILESHELAIDESILTGESLPVSKKPAALQEVTPLPERTNMVFGGTYVEEGQGNVLVTATGIYTEFGRIADAVIKEKNEKTPLQKAVGTIGTIITIITLVLVVLVYLLGLARGMEHLDIFLVAVAIAVGSIPEALPPGLTAILAVGVERIAKKQGIVRSLLAAETLGSATIIITDKTGTLTTGKLSLAEIVGLKGVLSGQDTSDEEKRQILTYAAANTNATVLNPTAPPGKWRFTGRALDTGILKAGLEYGLNLKKIWDGRKPVKLFSSARKYSVFSYDGKDIILGAPDILLSHAKINQADRQQLAEFLERESHAGKRLLGVGLKHDSANLALDFVGLLLFYDPLRPKMKEAIAEIEAAGCRVIMATGDLPGTATAVAKSLGWNMSPLHILSGKDMETMSDDELLDALKRVRVFARMTPKDKYRVIEMLEGDGEVVAMLGDGVNDAPSLKRASIGVAVGSGTDVAKGVADLILLNDNFHTIKDAMDEGRLIIANIRKTFVYLMSNCFDEILLLGGSLALGFTLPLSPLQVIWVNFMTGSIPAIAYAFDRQKGKHKAGEHAILNSEVLVLTFGIGFVSSLALLVLYAVLIATGYDTAVGRTFLFTCFSSYILFVAYSFRNLRQPLFQYRLFDNQVLNIGVAFGLVMLAATIYLPFFQQLFGTVSLPLSWLFLVLLWSAANVALVETAKWLILSRDERSRHTIGGQAERHNFV